MGSSAQMTNHIFHEHNSYVNHHTNGYSDTTECHDIGFNPEEFHDDKRG